MGMFMWADHHCVGFMGLWRLVSSRRVVPQGFRPGVGGAPGMAMVLLGRPVPPRIDTWPSGTH